MLVFFISKVDDMVVGFGPNYRCNQNTIGSF